MLMAFYYTTVLHTTYYLVRIIGDHAAHEYERWGELTIVNDLLYWRFDICVHKYSQFYFIFPHEVFWSIVVLFKFWI